MKHVAIALIFLSLGYTANAQSPELDKAPANKFAVTNTPPSMTREVSERRARARALLISLSINARSFHDQTLRARSLARIAEALWHVDPEQARSLFRKAWEAAEIADQENAATRGFQSEGPRAIATIAIAVAILNPKKGAASQ